MCAWLWQFCCMAPFQSAGREGIQGWNASWTHSRALPGFVWVGGRGQEEQLSLGAHWYSCPARAVGVAWWPMRIHVVPLVDLSVASPRLSGARAFRLLFPCTAFRCLPWDWGVGFLHTQNCWASVAHGVRSSPLSSEGVPAPGLLLGRSVCVLSLPGGSGVLPPLLPWVNVLQHPQKEGSSPDSSPKHRAA